MRQSNSTWKMIYCVAVARRRCDLQRQRVFPEYAATNAKAENIFQLRKLEIAFEQTHMQPVAQARQIVFVAPVNCSL